MIRDPNFKKERNINTILWTLKKQSEIYFDSLFLSLIKNLSISFPFENFPNFIKIFKVDTLLLNVKFSFFYPNNQSLQIIRNFDDSNEDLNEKSNSTQSIVRLSNETLDSLIKITNNSSDKLIIIKIITWKQNVLQ